MPIPTFDHDKAADTLYISFGPSESATGIELNEHILLRMNKEERRVVGLTLFDYSVLTEQTRFGPRSFPLDGLVELSPELYDMVLEALLSEPLRDILSLSGYTPAPNQDVPIARLHPLPTRAA
jgi:uncharacterized protein YuzE